ncbi:FadR/GntR family transcriptional regulator [Ramlibacter sp.]|uniref:FadR/GntR family transcriptional regulator n=1 Tax=Ramlibacter sp. TaxID=1917967 RepID=UPI003D12D049
MTMPTATPAKRGRSLTADLVQALGDRVRDGRWAAGAKLPTEGEIIAEFGVSRTVVREAISRLQAGGVLETRHGVGTFVLGQGHGSAFRIDTARLATLHEVIEVLELRIGVETESAALAAMRRSPAQVEALRSALEAFSAAMEEGRDAVGPDFQFHLEIARATGNRRFEDLVTTLGGGMIPRARLEGEQPVTPERLAYLRGVHAEHENILRAIERQDAEGARAAMRTHLANSKDRRERQSGRSRRGG